MSFYGKSFIGLPPKGIGNEPEYKETIADQFSSALMVWGYASALALLIDRFIA